MSSAGNDSFYVTTPIYYINDAPHFGHAYTTVVCDALARYHRLRGRDVRFLTGTDEHGQKAARSAEAAGITPRELADRNVARYRAAWEALGISHDDFIRTTEERHRRGAQELWRRIEAAGDIYKADYEGPYCVGCEAFYPESQLVEGACPAEPQHRIEVLSEESYYFRLSKYQEPLLELYRERPEMVTPASRLNEVRAFVEGGLEDLSISRTQLDWGLKVPGDPQHVMYVWIEALSNYITALGFGGDDAALFERYWPAELQVVGKDILRFHAVFWPAFLLSAGLEPPQQVLAHGWWLMNDQKMSKTRGNVANPFDLVEWFGADAVRYFLLREIALGADGNYSEEAIVDRINSDLANDLGNTLSRVSRIVAKELSGRVPRRPLEEDGLAARAARSWAGWEAGYEAKDPQAALKSTWELLDATNKFLVLHEPWKLLKDPEAQGRFEAVMHEAAEALRQVALQLVPAVPETSARIFAALGLGDPPERILLEDGTLPWGFPEGGEVISHAQGLFPRIDKKAFFAAEASRAAASAEAAKGGPAQPTRSARASEAGSKPARTTATASAGDENLEGLMIGIEDFMKVQLRTALVKDARKHPDADRLLVLELDDGSGTPRTICAGVAAFHSPEELLGRTLVVVANLKPRKLRGVESQGMLLAANYQEDGEERVRVILLPEGTPPGAEVR